MSAPFHVCRESRTCCCSLTALEPDEDCPVHGWPYPPRCEICGQFMKRTFDATYEETLAEPPTPATAP